MKQNATLPGLYPGISALDLLDEDDDVQAVYHNWDD